jgi:hypothetical protein
LNDLNARTGGTEEFKPFKEFKPFTPFEFIGGFIP